MTSKHDKKVAGMARKLEDETGRTLDEWVALVLADGPSRKTERHAWLVSTHGLGHSRARLVVTECERRRS